MGKVIDGEFLEHTPIERYKHMNGVFPPVGTIVGAAPNELARVVAAHDDKGVLLRTATPRDYQALMQRAEPFSVHEHGILLRQQRRMR
jgi:hypothetical protein